MPIARIKSVFSCNSEDENFPAENLMKEGKKWKCAEPGVDAAYVILQLEKPSKITGIDIGNEGSAYVTVFVGKSGWTEDRYKEILLTSTFMKPAEARNMDNPNRVRCYNSDILVENVRDEKWDMVKLVCTQSYNRKVKYGLAFVKIQTSDESNANANKNSNSITKQIASTNENTNETESEGAKLNTSVDDALGLPKENVFSQFKFRDESSDSDNEPASLFNKWKQETKSDNADDSVKSTAAAIRDSSSSISALEKTAITIKRMTPNRRTSQDKPTTSANDNGDDNKKKPKNRNRYTLIYDDEDDTTSDPKLEKFINDDKERIEKEKADRLAAKKKKDNNKPDSKPEKNKEKMASSADKFKQFLDADNSNGSKSDNERMEIETSNEQNDNTQSGNESAAGPATLSQASNASRSSQGTPNGAKRRSTAIDSSDSPMKRARQINNDDDDEDDEIPFNTILRGTTFVISGIPNPERGSLREKGIKMGAWYKADWDDSCTHLICAFPNTPKYKQVQAAKGKIVKREWISDCFDQKKKLPWRQYELSTG